MIIETITTLVTVCLTIQEWLVNPKGILKRLHMHDNGEPSQKPKLESEDELEEENEILPDFLDDLDDY